MTILTMLCALSAQLWSANKVDWYLYVWSESASGDLGQFEETEDANVYVIPACDAVPVEGINFCVRNGDWSTKYGWKDNSVTATGIAVELASASGATGWMSLPVGSYKVTFDASALTIRFDSPDSGDDEDEESYPDHSDSRQFLRGGDMTMATYMEDLGAVFRYADGTSGDVFAIMESYGVNLARLRLYNAPGTAVKSGSVTYRTPIVTPVHPNGYPYAGEDDIAALALRAKNHHMQICLSFHMSDYWTNATQQMIPAAWANAGSLNALGDSVYNYVYRYMSRLVAQGTTPEYVSVGNETNYGMLFQTTQGASVSYGGHTTNNGINNAVYLYNRAYDAIKAASPTSQVILHHSYGHDGKISACRSFFQNLKNNGCRYDIVGGSYYPAWASEQGSSDNTPNGMLSWASAMETAIGKPIMVMETGYSWTQYRPSGRNGGNYEGQLGMNGSYNEASEVGQRNFLCDLHDKIASDSQILGYMYWDPIFVDQQVGGSWIKSCWAEKYDAGYNKWWEDGNIISNTTWFDYSGKPLKALYQEVNSRKVVSLDDPTAVEQTELPATAEKLLIDGQLYVKYKGQMYNVQGQKVK